jgi:LuxR family maltose regulon positive regulatory protein
MSCLERSLSARFFGHFELYYGCEPVPLGRNAKALAILKYLLANPTRPRSQDHLMAWLWPESSAKKARGALHTTIHALRKVLDSYPLSGGCSSHILLEEDQYRLCPTIGVWTDVEEFDLHFEKGCSLEQAGRVSQAAEEYEKAVDLYRGDYLIEDLYEEWTAIERQRLANAYLEMLRFLSRYYIDVGHNRKSLKACYEILNKDPYHDKGHCLLMEYYAKNDMPTRALHQYSFYERMLRQRFGTEPCAEAQACYQEIVRSQYSASGLHRY